MSSFSYLNDYDRGEQLISSLLSATATAEQRPPLRPRPRPIVRDQVITYTYRDGKLPCQIRPTYSSNIEPIISKNGGYIALNASVQWYRTKYAVNLNDDGGSMRTDKSRVGSGHKSVIFVSSAEAGTIEQLARRLSAAERRRRSAAQVIARGVRGQVTA